MPYNKQLCVLGCAPSGVSHHRFPRPDKSPEIFKAWLKVVGGKINSPSDYEYYRNKTICAIHFKDEHKNRCNRLSALAVPTLHLPTRPVKSLLPPQRPEEEPNVIDCPKVTPPLSPSLDETKISYDMDMAAGIYPLSFSITEPSPYKGLSRYVNEEKPQKSKETSTTKDNLTESPTVHYVFPESEPDPDVAEFPSAKLYPSFFKEHNYSKQQIEQENKSAALHAMQRQQRLEIKNLKKSVKRLTSRNEYFKSKLKKAVCLSNDAAFKKVTKNMTSAATLFTKMQSAQKKKSPKGQRFTLEQKFLSLSLYMKGLKVYRYLSKLFTLPSVKTLRNLLNKIKIGSGLIDAIFDKIKDSVPNMTKEQKMCTLIFAEMPLTPKLDYDQAKDKLIGFTDFENKVIADHVLVFMVKGIKADYKEPVAYYFTSSVIQIQLKHVITDIIKKLQDVGLNVLCTVCDLAPSNVMAINELIEDNNNELLRMGESWQYDFFKVNNQEIIPLFDVPLLLTELRNDLVNNDLLYTDYKDNNDQKIVKWDYFLEVYKADKSLGELRGLFKIMKEHLMPEKINKNNVKTAAQIFSHRVAVITDHMVARKLVSDKCSQLIPVVLLIDNLFDSLNASSLHIPDGKVYQSCVKSSSPHHDLWKNALNTFRKMKFVTLKKTVASELEFVEEVTPSINGFIKTIEGMQVLWRILSVKYRVDHMLTRNFNKESLEDFFCKIKTRRLKHGVPNCLGFEEAYTFLLLNNPSSIEATCGKDSFEWLQKLFLNENLVASDVPEEDDMLTNFTDDVLVLQNEEITYTDLS